MHILNSKYAEKEVMGGHQILVGEDNKRIDWDPILLFN